MQRNIDTLEKEKKILKDKIYEIENDHKQTKLDLKDKDEQLKKL